MNYAGILAGGKGTRMGITERPKQYLKIGAKETPIIVLTIKAFLECDKIDQIVIATPAAWSEYTEVLIGEHFTEQQAGAVTYQEAVSMADESKPKDERKVFRYTHYSASFASDYKGGCMDGGRYHIRTIAGEKAPKVC